MATREINNAIIKEQLFKIGEANQKATAAKDLYRKRLKELEGQKDIYTDDARAEMKTKLRAELQAKLSAFHPLLKIEHEKLKAALVERDSQLDTSELVDTVNLIKSVGPELDHGTIAKINAKFQHNQPALKVLQASYRASGIVSDGGLEKQMYNVDTLLQKIEEKSAAAFLNGDSINQYAASVRALAELEGYPFEGMPDSAGRDEVLRAAAGLPATGE
jgi:hypothetical protein